MVSFSALIISQGREDLLLKCLNSLRPPGPSWQLILVGNGAPFSQAVLDMAHSLTLEVSLLELPEKVSPGRARNLGAKLAHHEWVYLIDDDAYVPPGYFAVAFEILAKQRVDVLGGPDGPALGMTHFSQALAITLSSPLCTGKTYSRHTSMGKKVTEAHEENLSSCNLWIKNSLLQENPFPEDYLRAEETALLIELERKGAHLFYHPRLSVAHFRRKNLKTLFYPSYYSGFYRSKVMREKKTRGTGSFFLPSLFVLLHLTAFLDMDLFLFLARIYLSLVVMMSLNLAARRQKTMLFPAINLLHYFIVFNYGLGFLSQRLGLHGRE